MTRDTSNRKQWKVHIMLIVCNIIRLLHLSALHAWEPYQNLDRNWRTTVVCCWTPGFVCYCEWRHFFTLRHACRVRLSPWYCCEVCRAALVTHNTIFWQICIILDREGKIVSKYGAFLKRCSEWCWLFWLKWANMWCVSFQLSRIQIYQMLKWNGNIQT